jgi:hypothetical protein
MKAKTGLFFINFLTIMNIMNVFVASHHFIYIPRIGFKMRLFVKRHPKTLVDCRCTVMGAIANRISTVFDRVNLNFVGSNSN